MKILLRSTIFTLCLALSLSVQAAQFLQKGYIQNDSGDKCWYTQRTETESKYFHDTLTGNAGEITLMTPVV